MSIACAIAIALLSVVEAGAQDKGYSVTPIVDNTQDSFLVNPWGLSRPRKASTTENEWWTSDNGPGNTTSYYADQSGSPSLAPLVVSVPSATGSGQGTPTGTAYNPQVGPGPGPDNFAFATRDGTISNWNSGTQPAQAGSGCYQCHRNTTTLMVNNNRKARGIRG
jgi:hypothetical protein